MVITQTNLSAWMKDGNPQLGRYDFTEVSVSFTTYLVKLCLMPVY